MKRILIIVSFLMVVFAFMKINNEDYERGIAINRKNEILKVQYQAKLDALAREQSLPIRYSVPDNQVWLNDRSVVSVEAYGNAFVIEYADAPGEKWKVESWTDEVGEFILDEVLWTLPGTPGDVIFRK